MVDNSWNAFFYQNLKWVKSSNISVEEIYEENFSLKTLF